MADTPPAYRRRRYWIDPVAQRNILFIFMLIYSVNLLAIILGLSAYFGWVREMVERESGISSDFLQWLLHQQMVLMRIVALDAIIGFVIMLIGGILVSHKVVGPVHRLKLHLQALAAGGPVKPVAFRKGDMFMELADDFNKILPRIRETADSPPPAE